MHQKDVDGAKKTSMLSGLKRQRNSVAALLLNNRAFIVEEQKRDIKQ